ncbi:MAG TPA: hypothetical protein VIK81_00760 [Patescibacteria group bacterium]
MKKELEIKNLFIKKNLGLILVVFAIILTALLAVSLIQPKFQQLTDTQKSKAVLEQKRDTNLATLNNLKAIDIKAEQKRLSGVDQLIPAYNDVFSSLSLIESLAISNQLTVISNRGEGVTQVNGAVTSYLIQSTFEGDYLQIRGFLESLYKSRRAIGIQNASLNLQGEQAITLNAIFYLPVSQANFNIGTIDTVVSSLTPEEEEIIGTLKDRSFVPASTASATLGRSNPFLRP